MPISNYANLLEGDLLYEGQIADLQSAVVRSYINADTDVLVFGRAVFKGTGDRDLIYPTGAGSVLMGIAVKTDIFEKRLSYSVNADGDMGYPLKYVVSLLIRGTIGVKVTQAVTAGSSPFWIHTPATGERKGQFRTDNTGAVAFPQARFLRSGAANTVVPLAIDLI